MASFTHRLRDPSPEQEQSLSDAVQWGIVGGGALIVGDAGLRAARNQADARRDAAAFSSGGEPHDAILEEIPDEERPSDEQEGLGPAVVQPSQSEPGR